MEIAIAVIGWVGAVLLLAAYGMLTTRVISGASWSYQTLNLLGAVALMLNSAYFSAWPSALLNIAWLAVGVFGLARGLRLRRRERRGRDVTAP